MDLAAASAFVTMNARLLDRHRFSLATGTGDPPGAFAALAAYRNPDGGFGWGLEPDLRSPESQPAAALHAFEAMAEIGPVTSEPAVRLCDWLDMVTLPDDGLPFALPITDPAGTAPWWAGADHGTSSLQITAAVAGAAHLVARNDPAVAGHGWLARATDFCWQRIAALERPPAMELQFALTFLDSVRSARPEAADLGRRLGAFVPADGVVPVEGGAEGEAIHLLDLSPEPGGVLRDHLDPAAVDAELDRLAAAQRDDGGWEVDFVSSSAAGALEWRGSQTVWAVRTLRANGRL